jgi:hypothetical protein
MYTVNRNKALIKKKPCGNCRHRGKSDEFGVARVARGVVQHLRLSLARIERAGTSDGRGYAFQCCCGLRAWKINVMLITDVRFTSSWVSHVFGASVGPSARQHQHLSVAVYSLGICTGKLYL